MGFLDFGFKPKRRISPAKKLLAAAKILSKQGKSQLAATVMKASLYSGSRRVGRTVRKSRKRY